MALDEFLIHDLNCPLLADCKPCAHCRGTELSYVQCIPHEIMKKLQTHYAIVCIECKSRGPLVYTKSKNIRVLAVKAWNYRDGFNVNSR